MILDLLASSPGRTRKRGELNAKLKTKAAASLGLTPAAATDVLDRLAADGLVRSGKRGRAVVYEFTDAGAQYLDQVRHHLPARRRVGSRGKIMPPANDAIRGYRADYLLLQVLRAPRHEITEADANDQLDTYAREGLELNAATASQLRRDLVGQGLLVVTGSGRAARYSLALAGRVALGNANFPAERPFALTGRVLNDLLEVAREVGKQFGSDMSMSGQPPAAPDVPGTILAAFSELLRERHAFTGLVPIAEVRAAVRERLGEAAARHDVFDEAALGLWRAGKVRLTPIFDPAKASPDQLQEAIPGVGETLFYLEAAREPAPV
jgi:DNA-binding MarR family transcriptional regulator